MIRSSLESFVTEVTSAGEITLADVRRLQRTILPHGPDDRDEADMLIALDRAVLVKHCTWSAYAITTIVDFVVWTSRPTGYVDRDTATWLVASLTAGAGPSKVAEAIAFEVAREAERSDHALLSFVMRSAAARLPGFAGFAPDQHG
jgi:hypothetical protein